MEMQTTSWWRRDVPSNSNESLDAASDLARVRRTLALANASFARASRCVAPLTAVIEEQRRAPLPACVNDPADEGKRIACRWHCALRALHERVRARIEPHTPIFKRRPDVYLHNSLELAPLPAFFRAQPLTLFAFAHWTTGAFALPQLSNILFVTSGAAMARIVDGAFATFVERLDTRALQWRDARTGALKGKVPEQILWRWLCAQNITLLRVPSAFRTDLVRYASAERVVYA